MKMYEKNVYVVIRMSIFLTNNHFLNIVIQYVSQVIRDCACKGFVVQGVIIPNIVNNLVL